jgi:hypothetical protein
MALTSAADAEIVYTPLNKTIGRDASYNIDLNGDGIVDFILTEHAYKDGSFGTNQLVALDAANGNQVACPSSFCISGESIVAALSAGTSIGPHIQPKGWIGRHVPMAFEVDFLKAGSVLYSGEWVNERNRYAGLKFKINGEYHYGWARMSVQFHGGKGEQRTWVAQLTGFAYETIAAKPIVAGMTKGQEDDEDAVSAKPSGMQPKERAASASLASLALGAEGLALWRKEESLGSSAFGTEQLGRN